MMRMMTISGTAATLTGSMTSEEIESCSEMTRG